MKAYTVIKISTGDERLELDEVEVFDTYEKAVEGLKQLYEETLEDVEGYDLLVDDLDDTYFSIQIDDDYATEYYGRLKVREVC